MKKYIINVWDKLNVMLILFTVINAVPCLVLSILSFVYFYDNNLHSVFLGWCSIFASLSSAFFIAFFVRYHDLREKKATEKSALQLMKPYFEEIFCCIDSFYPQLRAFATINKNDTLDYPTERVYYKRIGDDTYRSFIDFDIEFKKSKGKLDSIISKCESSFAFKKCNDKVLDLITRLKFNGLTRNLKDLIDMKTPPQLTMLAFLYNNFQEYSLFYEEFALLTGSKKCDDIQLLSVSEKEEYLHYIEENSQKLIESVSNPPSSKVYFNNRRIQ